MASKPGRKRIGARRTVVLTFGAIRYIDETRNGRDFSARARDLLEHGIKLEGGIQAERERGEP